MNGGALRILLCNDDGISAPGLNCLATVLGTEHEVYVIAPDRERSGVGHAFTLTKPLRCDEAPALFPSEFVARAWSCSGTPVDCVKMGILKIFADDPPDLVVSGVNRGSNLSVDHLYSGTVAGALEAVIEGVPAIAISVEIVRDSKHHHFEAAAEFVRRFLLDEASKGLLSNEYALNINVPAMPIDETKGFRMTCIASCNYIDKYIEHRDPHGRPYYWLEGKINVEDDRSWADIVALREGYVSITPLSPNMTNHRVLKELREKLSQD